MSEYQYYEFQAIDKPLTSKEIRKLRSYSTRARITPTSFVNHYNWGNFKGDEDAWMEKYFDAFLYLANWGTRVLKIRLSSKLLPLKIARQYCPGGPVSAREKAGKVIITFVSEDKKPGDWEEGDGWLASVVPVRAEIARGDLRALYLGWLLCAQSGNPDGSSLEPPVQSNLESLSASLHSLVEFLRLDEHFLSAAASTSTKKESPRRNVLAGWVAALPPREKDKMLVRLMKDGDARLGHELLARFDRERHPDDTKSDRQRRTVDELFQAADRRRQAAARKAAKEKTRRDREKKIKREKYLDGLAGRETKLWAKVERLVAEKQQKSYDQALTLLVDLRDLAARERGSDFRQRIDALQAAHARKATFIERLEKAGLLEQKK